MCVCVCVCVCVCQGSVLVLDGCGDVEGSVRCVMQPGGGS